jgi:hypothetical protein
VQEVGETLQGVTVSKLRRESVFKNAGETKDTGFVAGTKVEVFGTLEIFQVQEEEWKFRRELQLSLDHWGKEQRPFVVERTRVTRSSHFRDWASNNGRRSLLTLRLTKS